ncbi:hypothetical protein PORY_000501 [Pneumocystis oryctolagi]|uniref:Uncharacterized protein n=1 Tax=Pneumocystis oryctolagi TaxID=42067 RepID=A0ACB7CH22_9ASCO|nr:hypothetical protein PORY_000501 [Pneumocystis oryctolagi]
MLLKMSRICLKRNLHIFPRQETVVFSLKANPVFSKTKKNFTSKSYVKKDAASSKPVEGRVPTTLEQATGIERLELLRKMAGEDAFDLNPLNVSRVGTLKDPITVQSLNKTRIIGCTGFPVDSHDVLWFELSADKQNSRCPECGNVYKLDFIGTENTDSHH